MATIQALSAREILDSLGIPTLEVSLWLDSGAAVVASIASGTSTGRYETTDLRDHDHDRMVGKGVLQAVANINQTIAPQLIGKDPTDQAGIDQLLLQLDGTEKQSRLGGNTLIAVSLAVLKAGALSHNLPVYYYLQQKFQLTDSFALPTCIFTMIDGGAHGSENLDFQEFQIIPASFLDYPTALNMAVTLYQKLEEVLVLHKAIHSTGTLGGFTPNLMTNGEVFELLAEAIKASNYVYSQDVFFGLDAGANALWNANRYRLKDKPQPYTATELIAYYRDLRQAHKVIYFEDAFSQEDVKSYQDLMVELGQTTNIAVDSMIDGSSKRVAAVTQQKAANTFVLKPSKQATVTELLLCVSEAKKAAARIVLSHRSGETNDDVIADIAVGVGADYVKFGAVNRQERLAKYNRLTQIHQELAAMAASAPTPEATAATASETPAQPEVPPTA